MFKMWGRYNNNKVKTMKNKNKCFMFQALRNYDAAKTQDSESKNESWI